MTDIDYSKGIAPIDEIVWRTDLYPRFEHDPATVQQYADSLDVLPPIEINQHSELIDGYHRWLAHKKQEASDVPVVITQTASDAEVLMLAIKRNATHGLQLNIADKRRMCRQIYNPPQTDKKELAATLSVTVQTITSWVKNIDQQHKEDQRRRVREMWLACRTQEEIADALGTPRQTISNQTKDLPDLKSFSNRAGLHAKYGEPDWKPPLFNIWNFAKNANKTKHFGNTHVGIVDNLLYTFTEPFDVVVDPFGGGGSTIDICKERLRRYWVSDRKPPVERPDIRTHDIVTDGVAGPYLWGDVALVYLDPPYWKQAQRKYSDDPTDLANMPLEKFNKHLIALINEYGKKLRIGGCVACIISPTQWPNEDKHIDMHDLDLAVGVNKPLRLIRRAICPYSTEQYNGTQVDIAKTEKLWLVLNRTLLVWEKQVE